MSAPSGSSCPRLFDRHTTRRLLLILGVPLVILVSVAVGVWLGLRLATFPFQATTAFSISSWGQHAWVAYQHAEPQEAERILLDYVRLLEDPFVQEHPPFGVEILAADSMLTLGRLAVLASRNRDEAKAARYLRQAHVRCTRAGYSDCTESFIANYVARLDRPWRAPQPNNAMQPTGEGGRSQEHSAAVAGG